MADADLRRDLEAALARVRRGRDDLGAHPVALHRLDDGVGDGLARGPPRDLLCELAREVDELLHEKRTAPRVFGERGEPVVGLGRGGDDPHTLAVVAAARASSRRRGRRGRRGSPEARPAR